jgi:phospholipase C
MPDTGRIKHVIHLMLENHSFDQMLGCFKSIYPEVDGVDPANLRSCVDKDGKSFAQSETNEVQTASDPKHEFDNVRTQMQDGNKGFLKDFTTAYPGSSAQDRQEIMGYYGMGKLPALHALAKEFTICDKWFASMPGPTWPNRFFALTGTSNGEIEMPSGSQQLDPRWYTHQTQPTIFDRLNEANKKWKVYYYDFPNSWLLLRQLEPQNAIHYHHIDTFFNTDTRNAATFPEFVFIEPKYFGQDQNDDHPPHNVMKAEKLVADVYNAIRSNPELWESSLLVITFDEHGGFYDHVVPPAAVPPDDKTSHYAFNQYGMRVPALLVSPWVGRRTESTVFDHTSVLKFMTEKWGLKKLTNRTDKANSLDVALTESQPRTGTIPFIRVPYTDLIPPRPDLEKVDSNSHQQAIEGFSAFLAKKFEAPAVEEAKKLVGWFTKTKNFFGRQILRAGNALTNAYQEAQATKIDNLADFAKDVAKKGMALGELLK